MKLPSAIARTLGLDRSCPGRSFVQARLIGLAEAPELDFGSSSKTITLYRDAAPNASGH
ncbi:hypothetical protein W911_09285 [Hyphomicrobium nitrativorans NL23]|uniref:Uncharacterized protein n=1 Tax=Hyphomicrobium nitrativorans NL23 TaxID=1029756 RepID=V5SGZ2_9HYPH|nr:hypothetical protein W911_09285 [Hyphomicrobium nitrativorans NL23]